MSPSLRLKRRHTRAGAPPGIPQMPDETSPTAIHVIAYSQDAIVEETFARLQPVLALRDRFDTLWIDVVGHGNSDFLEQLRDAIGLHALAIEDVVNLGQRPKLEEFDSNLFCVTRMIAERDGDLVSEQLAIFLAEGVVVTFQEYAGDCLEPVRDRLRESRGRIRRQTADYLFYAIIDAVVDAYIPLIEDLGDQLEAVEECVLLNPPRDAIRRIHEAKVHLLLLRKAIVPLREALDRLFREEVGFVTDDTLLYFRDCVDHLARATDHIDAYRDLANSVLDTHMSVVSHRMNDVMALLTMISVIFIPLSFLAGLWGMNFDTNASPLNMPELRARYGYPMALGLMLAIAVFQLWFFRRKGWLRLGR